MKESSLLAPRGRRVSAGGRPRLQESDHSLRPDSGGRRRRRRRRRREQGQNAERVTGLVKQYFAAINRGDKATLDRLLAPVQQPLARQGLRQGRLGEPAGGRAQRRRGRNLQRRTGRAFGRRGDGPLRRRTTYKTTRPPTRSATARPSSGRTGAGSLRRSSTALRTHTASGGKPPSRPTRRVS